MRGRVWWTGEFQAEERGVLGILSLGLAVSLGAEPVESTAATIHVVVEPDMAGEAIAELVASTGRPVADFVPLSVAEALQDVEPFLVQSGGETCPGTTVSSASLHELIEALQGAVDYFELDRARVLAKEGIDALGCLGSQFDSQLVARLYFLSGVAAVGDGDGEAAAMAFRRARVFVPDLAWDENYPPDGRLVFDAISAETVTTVALTIMPAPTESLRFDGHIVDETSLNLAKGLHYLQNGVEPVSTYTAILEKDDVLVVPSAFGAEVLQWIGDESQQDRLTDLLKRRFEEEKAIYVSHGGEHWLLDLAEGSWAPLEKRRQRTTGGQGQPPVALIVGGSGGAIFLSGAIVGVVGLAKGLKLKNGVETWEDYEDAQEPYRAARSQLVAGEVLAALGAATLGTGLTPHFVMGK